MESQRIVFMEEAHLCHRCERLVCKITRGNGKHDHVGCECSDDDTELLFVFDFPQDDTENTQKSHAEDN